MLATQTSGRTIAIDPTSGRLYIPAAKFGPAMTAGGRPPLIPGSFVVLVIGTS